MSDILLFDIGNSRLKWACVGANHDPSERHKKIWDYSGAIDLRLLDSKEHRAELAHYIKSTIPKPVVIGICCVAAESYYELLQELFGDWQGIPTLRIFGNSEYPQLRTQYQNTQTLGADRWAAIIAARQLSQDNSLVICAGTATTIDFLGSNGVHHGGWIIPGVSLMRNSLLDHTARLDVPRDGIQGHGIGLSTSSAIDEGCLLAHAGAILSALEFAKQKNQAVSRIWIDGGHADTLLVRLSQMNIKAEKISGLVLRGLWAWVKTKNELAPN